MAQSKKKSGGHLGAKRQIPSGHPLRNYLRRITSFVFDETGIRDGEVALYVSDMLADFAHVDNLYRIRDERGRRLMYLVDMLAVSETLGRDEEQEARKHIGDYCMFIIGIFPESIDRGGRRPVSPSLYMNEGKRSYLIAAEMGDRSGKASFYGKLADKFEHCVSALSIEKEYLFDPFYQYILRQFESL